MGDEFVFENGDESFEKTPGDRGDYILSALRPVEDTLRDKIDRVVYYKDAISLEDIQEISKELARIRRIYG